MSPDEIAKEAADTLRTWFVGYTDPLTDGYQRRITLLVPHDGQPAATLRVEVVDLGIDEEREADPPETWLVTVIVEQEKS